MTKNTFVFAVIQNCVLLYDKSNASKLNKQALMNDEKSITILQQLDKFDNARSTIVQTFFQKFKTDCLETLMTCELVEEYDLKSKCLLVCSKKRGTTKSFIIPYEKKRIYNAFFYLQNFNKIIKEAYLGYLKKEDLKIAILTNVTFDMWQLFREKVVILTDYIHNHKC